VRGLVGDAMQAWGVRGGCHATVSGIGSDAMQTWGDVMHAWGDVMHAWGAGRQSCATLGGKRRMSCHIRGLVGYGMPGGQGCRPVGACMRGACMRGTIDEG
jgi:hypothetical protein